MQAYQTLRVISATSDTAISASTATAAIRLSTFTNPNAINNAVEVPLRAISANIIFWGTDAEDETLTWALNGYRKDIKRTGGPAEYIAHGTGILGKVRIVPGSASEGLYADTIVITAQAWPHKDDVTSAGTTLYTTLSGANSSVSIAKLTISHLWDYKYLYMTMTKDNCATVAAKIAYTYK